MRVFGIGVWQSGRGAAAHGCGATSGRPISFVMDFGGAGRTADVMPTAMEQENRPEALHLDQEAESPAGTGTPTSRTGGRDFSESFRHFSGRVVPKFWELEATLQARLPAELLRAVMKRQARLLDMQRATVFTWSRGDLRLDSRVGLGSHFGVSFLLR